jgi:phospholipase C
MSTPKSPGPVTRRAALQGTLGVAATVALGCSDDGATGTDGTGGSGGSGTTSTTGTTNGTGTTTGTGGSGGSGGAGGGGLGECPDNAGLYPGELLAPIQTIVVLCMENRSFDHYLGSLKLAEGQMDVEGLNGNESNPDGNGGQVPVHNLLDFTPEDPPHSWDASHAQWNMGANDGFVIAHAGASQDDVMGYHLRTQIPTYYALADGSAVCDHWFASVMGPTWPNRYYLHGGTSKGQKANLHVIGFKSIWQQLDAAGISNKNYYHDIAWCSGAYAKLSGLAGIDKFFSDAAAGTLPAFSIIDPQFFGSGANDDHPDHDIQLGQALISAVYAALAQSPQWGSCLFVLTYDEHGGFYDHVPPPMTDDDDDEFRQMGFRVPAIVAGPFVKKGCVVSTVFDHASVAKTLSVRYGLPTLNQRIAAANDLSACIHPDYLTDPQPPVTLPVLNISLSVLDRPVRGDHHSEMREAAESGRIPAHLDRRAQGKEIARSVLEHAERLGVVRLKA